MNNEMNKKGNRSWLVAMCCILAITNIVCLARIVILENKLHPSAKQEFSNLNWEFEGCDTLNEAVNTEKVWTIVNTKPEPARFRYFFKGKEEIVANLYYDGESTPLKVDSVYDVSHSDYTCSYTVTLDNPGRYVVEIGYKDAIIYHPLHLSLE